MLWALRINPISVSLRGGKKLWPLPAVFHHSMLQNVVWHKSRGFVVGFTQTHQTPPSQRPLIPKNALRARSLSARRVNKNTSWPQTAHWSPLWNSSARPRWLFTFFLIVLKQSDVIQADMHVITANNLSANLSHRTPKPDSGYPLDLTGFHSTLTEPSYSTTTLTDKFSIK